MALLPPLFNAQFFTDAGAVAADYLLYTYESGTTTDKATFTDQAGASENENPIELDAAGRCNLWLDDGEYTFVLKTPADVTVWTRDDVAGVPEAEEGSFVPLAGGTMTGLLTLSGNAQSALHAVPKQQLDASVAALSATLTPLVSAAVPIGAVALWLTGSPPTNWLHLNGAAVSRTTYSALFALWGTTFGVGDGSTTFTLPDVRGEFPRFWDASRGVDAGRSIGTAQAADTQSHYHSAPIVCDTDAASGVRLPFGSDTTTTVAQVDYKDVNSTTVPRTSAAGGSENRPRNFAFMAIVKAL